MNIQGTQAEGSDSPTPLLLFLQAAALEEGGRFFSWG